MKTFFSVLLAFIGVSPRLMTAAPEPTKSPSLIVRSGVVTAVDKEVTIRESDGARSSCFFWHSTVGRRKALLGAHVRLTCIVSLNTPIAIKIEADRKHAP